MTSEEAIAIIRRKTSIPDSGEAFEDIEKAYDMAIEALEKQISKKHEAIQDEPAADVVPVVHGAWITIDDTSRCSECGYIPAYDSAIDDLFYSPFCPNCGAKMDGKERQNNE